MSRPFKLNFRESSQTFKLNFRESNQSFKLIFDETCQKLNFEFSDLQVVYVADVETYDGDYTIIPTFDEQRMSTENKLMIDDMTILSIPYSEVSNPEGGLTINIGG